MSWSDFGKRKHYEEEPSREGTVVRMSGARTGVTSCGKVLATGLVGQMYARASYCGNHGDSGGPVYYKGTAYGINIAGEGQCQSLFIGATTAQDLAGGRHPDAEQGTTSRLLRHRRLRRARNDLLNQRVTIIAVAAAVGAGAIFIVARPDGTSSTGQRERASVRDKSQIPWALAGVGVDGHSLVVTAGVELGRCEWVSGDAVAAETGVGVTLTKHTEQCGEGFQKSMAAEARVWTLPIDGPADEIINLAPTVATVPTVRLDSIPNTVGLPLDLACRLAEENGLSVRVQGPSQSAFVVEQTPPGWSPENDARGRLVLETAESGLTQRPEPAC